MSSKLRVTLSTLKKVLAESFLKYASLDYFARNYFLILIFLTLVFKISTFIFILDKPLLPDEMTYAFIAQTISNDSSPLDRGTYYYGLFRESLSVAIPSHLLINLGIEPLNSVRIVSIIYSILSCLIFVKVAHIFISNFQNSIRVGKSKAFGFCFVMFVFLPSHFFWNSLALRESATEFWFLTVTYFSFKVFSTSGFRTMSTLVFLTCSLSCLFTSRWQTGLVVVFALLVYTLFCAFIHYKKSISLQMCISVLIGLLVGISNLGISNNSYLETYQETIDAQANPSPSNTESENGNLIPNSNWMKENFKLFPSSTRDSVQKIRELASNIDQKSLAGTEKAGSAFRPNECIMIEPTFERIVCNILRIPGGLIDVLFRPVIYMDTGSLPLNLASIENLIWTTMFLYLIFQLPFLLRRAKLEPNLLLFLLIIGGYSVGMSLYEGNMGTAFRHKSFLLSPILLLSLYVYIHKLDSKQGPNSVYEK
jgi:hypothetical protein